MITQRRLLLKTTAAGGAIALLAGAGLLTPTRVLAALSRDAFELRDADEAIKNATGGEPQNSDAISIKAPDIAENGAVVPVTISSTLNGVDAIWLFAANNPLPLTSAYEIPEGTEAYVSTRIKMGKTGDVIAVVRAGDSLFAARKEVKVTIGGCGG